MVNSAAWKSFIGFGKESTYGTAVAATAWLSGHGTPSLKMNRTYLDSVSTQESRSLLQSVETTYMLEGSIPEIEVRNDEIDLLLEAAFGTVSSDVYTLLDGTLPSLTVEENVGGVQGFTHRGVKVNTLSMTTDVEGFLTASVDLVGKQTDKTAVGALTSRSFSSNEPFVFYQGVFKLDSAEVKIWNMDFSLENNLKHPNFASGDVYTREQVEGVRSVTGTFSLDFEDTTFYDNNIVATTGALEYLFTNGAEEMKIEFPKVVFPVFKLDKTEHDTPQQVNFTALKQDASNKEVTITITSA